MDNYTATEIAYKNGYDKGYEEATNRLQAEIEHWQKKWTENYRKGGIDTIKFFADRLKYECLYDEELVNVVWINVMNHIDNLVKEMVGDNDD